MTQTESRPLELTWARFGEILTVFDVVDAPMFVWHRCGHPTVQWVCSTCNVTLYNAGQLEMHLEAGGAHHIATRCQRHGIEEGEAPTSFQLEAL